MICNYKQISILQTPFSHFFILYNRLPSWFQFGLWGCGGVLAVQTQPKQVLELGEVVFGDGGDVDGGHIVR